MFFLSKRGQGMARCDAFHWCYWCSSATDCYWLTAGSYLRPSFSAHFRSALRPHLGDLMPLARAPAYPSYQLVSTYLYSFLFNIFQWWIMVDSSLMDAVWCLPWPLVRVMIQGYSRNLNSFAKDDGRSQQRVCHGSADCRPGGVCTSLAPTDFGSLTLLEYADACT